MQWFWRRDDKGVMDGYPVEMSRFWYGLPSYVDSIDAVYERPGDGRIVFFKGEYTFTKCSRFYRLHLRDEGR